MKVLKYLGIGIAALFVIYVIWAACSPARLDMTASTEINREVGTVYDAARDFNLYRTWNPWSKLDTAAKNTITGNGKELGDSWSWDGEKMPKGGMVHSTLEPNKKIVNTITFVGEEGGIADEWQFEEKDGKTTVTWVTKAEKDTPFLMRPMMGLMMNGLLEKGLADFKAMVESIKDLPQNDMAYEPVVAEEAEITYIALKDSCPVGELSKHLEMGFGKLEGFMKDSKIEMAGAPMAIYWNYDPQGSTIFEVAIPVPAGTKGKGDIYVGKTDGGKTITVTHMGPYEKSGDAHMAIEKYSKTNNLQIHEGIEIYENDPSTVKPEEIKTKVMYPVKG